MAYRVDLNWRAMIALKERYQEIIEQYQRVIDSIDQMLQVSCKAM